MILNKIYNGDSLAVLKTLPDESVDCCITSPPYWQLRVYDDEGVMINPNLDDKTKDYIQLELKKRGINARQ